MSATWPRRSRCCGRSRTDEPPEIDDAHRPHSDSGRAAALGTPAGSAAGARARCSTISMRRAGTRCSSWRWARCASGLPRGWPSRRSPTRSGSMSRRSRRCGTGFAPPYRRAVRLGGGPRRAADRARRAGVPAVHARPSARRDEGLARRLCRRVEMGRDPGPAGPRRRRDAALQPHRRRISGSFPDVAEAFRTRRRARRRTAGARDGPGRRRRAWRRGGELQRAPATARAQERQPEDARRLSGVRPALRHIVRRRRGFARAAVGAAAHAARSLRRASSIPTGSTSRN